MKFSRNIYSPLAYIIHAAHQQAYRVRMLSTDKSVPIEIFRALKLSCDLGDKGFRITRSTELNAHRMKSSLLLLAFMFRCEDSSDWRHCSGRAPGSAD
jgi:hypothetical protein